MSKAGWFRLWVLISVIGVPAATVWQAEVQQRVWADLDKDAMQFCVETQQNATTHPDALACGHRMGVDKGFFEREHTTPLRFWTTGLGIMFLADVAITGVLVVLVLAIRWVVRGFRPTAHHSR